MKLAKQHHTQLWTVFLCWGFQGFVSAFCKLGYCSIFSLWAPAGALGGQNISLLHYILGASWSDSTYYIDIVND